MIKVQNVEFIRTCPFISIPNSNEACSGKYRKVLQVLHRWKNIPSQQLLRMSGQREEPTLAEIWSYISILFAMEGCSGR